ncbi:copper-binding protein [Geitlerinema sp. CS-897]|nr:copper-binding protein [Geitlerinema sp. CS-897]
MTIPNLHPIVRGSIVLAIALLINLYNTGIAAASSQTAIARVETTEVPVSLGSAADELKFFPNNFEFVAGRTYKLVLDNPSPQKHYFTAKDFADASWTRKVEAGNVEIKGAIHELELKPASVAEWVFVPEKPGTYDLRCTIAGHAEAGMTGTIRIVTEKR